MKYIQFIILNILFNEALFSQNWARINLPYYTEHLSNLITSTDEYFILSKSGNLHYSHDKGKSWKINFLGRNNHNCKIILKETVNKEVILQYDCNFYLFNRNDEEWSLMNTDSKYFDIEINSHDVFYGITKSGFFISHDYGKTTILKKSLELQDGTIKSFEDNINYLLKYTGNNYWLYIFDDKGENFRLMSILANPNIHFNKLNNNLISINTNIQSSNNLGRTNVALTLPSSFEKLYTILELTQGKLLLLAHPNCFTSLDGGISWLVDSSFSIPRTIGNNYKFSLSGENNIMLHSNQLSYLINDEINFQRIDINESLDSINKFNVFENNNLWVRSTNQLQFMSIDNGASWFDLLKNFNKPPDSYIDLPVQLQDQSILLNSESEVLRTNDFGLSWDLANFPRIFSNDIQIIPSKFSLFFANDKSLFISTNNAQSWRLIFNSLKSKISLERTDLFISENNILYYGQYDLDRPDYLYYSTVNGLIWESRELPNFDQDANYIFISGNSNCYWTGYHPSENKQLIYYMKDFSKKIDTLEYRFSNFTIDPNDYFYFWENENSFVHIFNPHSKYNYNLELPEIPNSKNPVTQLLVSKDNSIYIVYNNKKIYKHNGIISYSAERKETDNCLLIQYHLDTQITIHIPDDYLTQSSMLDIINLEGKIIKSISIKFNNYNIDCSHYNSGIYLARATTKNGNVSASKFIIN